MTHTPVLLQSVIQELGILPEMHYIDATAGEGGHIQAFLEKKAFVLGIDQDASQIEKLREKFKEEPHAKLTVGNFANIQEIAQKEQFTPVDGVLFDLGLSLRQVLDSGRGFSYRALEDPLDMRANESLTTKASDIIQRSAPEQLYEIFAKNSEEIRSKKIAEVIATRKKHMRTVKDLLEAINLAVGEKDTSVYARIMQALRMEVNSELDNLKKGLTGADQIIKKDGRIAVITFHSVEDRIVKQFMKENGFKQTTKNVIKGDRTKSYERSAKLRIMQRI